MSVDNLTCPLTLTWFVDPVVVPCCGQAISKKELSTWVNQNHKCPLCAQYVSSVDNLPIARNLVYLVEEQQKNHLDIDTPIELFQKNEWEGVLKYATIGRKRIGRIEINNTIRKAKTLLIPIVDESGSMSGNPTKQVKYSLEQIFDATYDNDHLITHIISYSDNTQSFPINKTIPKTLNLDIISKIGRGGGTNFTRAFDELVRVCNLYSKDKYIDNVVVIFLTDGEDSLVQKSSRHTLITNLQNKLILKIPYVIHSVGFSASHDFDFLDKLRKIGTTEGAYRYADPNEGNDSLSNKINSLLNIIVQTNSVKFNTEYPIGTKVLHIENNVSWFDMTNMELFYKLNIIPDNEIISVDLQVLEDQSIDVEWYRILIDQLTGELIDVNNNNTGLDKMLHCQLIETRAKSILMRIDQTNPDYNRIEHILVTIALLKKGEIVSEQKLNDMKYEGKFRTKPSLQQIKPQQQTIVQQPIIRYRPSYTSWITINKNYKRCFANKHSHPVFIYIGQCKSINADNYTPLYYNCLDINGSTPLIVASSIGRCSVVKAILATNNSDLHKTNNMKLTALDSAILFGMYHTAEILLKYGASITEPESLLRSCLSNKYYKTAKFMIDNNLVQMSDDIINSAPTSQIAQWLSENFKKPLDIKTAIEKGIANRVQELIDSIDVLDLNEYYKVFINPSSDHLNVLKLLIEKKKIDVNQIINIKVINKNIEEDEITNLLFMASENGNIRMFDIILKYAYNDAHTWQNLKGTTCLWIACCNKHHDIVIKLLDRGADPNQGNIKGDGPLIAACQKGDIQTINILLDSGANIFQHNKNRDNAILICCRTGQTSSLELLLSKLNSEDQKHVLNFAAEIDGFNPLFASVELDKVGCVEVCLKYGSNIEDRTDNDNQILPNATPLHLAAFYGRTKSLQLLLDKGANCLSQMNDGSTVLHLAIKNGHIDATRILLNNKYGYELLNIEDSYGKTASYYAKANGNEKIYEEFFTNPLSDIINTIMHSNDQTEIKCAQILANYGSSIGCYDDILNLDINGSNILNKSLLTGNNVLANTLLSMGADITKNDQTGLNAEFWGTYLGNIQFDRISETTQQRIDSVKKLTNTRQNKMLLDFVPQRKQLLENNYGESFDIIMKMTNGHGQIIDENTLKTLIESTDMEHSLVGFIDRIKNNKSINTINPIVDAKTHLIKVIALGETILQPIHIMAIYLYTSNWNIFKQVNMLLSDWNTKSFGKDIELWRSYVQTLYQSIMMLPNINNVEVYRVIDSTFNPNMYAIGKEVSWNTFSVGSLQWRNCVNIFELKKGMVFIIKNKTGKHIMKYSSQAADDEIIWLPGTKFKVINHYQPSITALGQANIRQSTYSMNDICYNKVLSGTSSIIIELEEVI